MYTWTLKNPQSIISNSVAQALSRENSTIETSDVGLNVSTQIKPTVVSNNIEAQTSYSNLPNTLNNVPRPSLVSQTSLTESTNLSKLTKGPNQSPTISIGTNLGGISYYSSESPFKDGFNSSGKWFTQKLNASGSVAVWNTNEQNNLNLDANGWVKSISSTKGTQKYNSIATLLYTGLGGNYQSGKYVVLYDGEGQIQYQQDAKKDVAASSTHRDVINVTPSNHGIVLQIVGTNSNNYIRNIRVIPIQYENNYQTDIFNPKFIEKIDPFGTLRFMDWMKTNNSTQKNWSERSTLNSQTWATAAPVEVMVDLANKTNSNPWFTIPHQATDDYVRQFAQYVKANLKPGLKVYVEYSNEVWNGGFQQAKYALQQGKNAWPTSTDNDSTKRINWYSKRTTEVVGIWDQVFATQTDRVIGVMGAQSSNIWTAQQALSYAWSNSGQTSSDYGVKALAIAPYFGNYLGSSKNKTQVQAWTRDADGGLNKLFTELTKGGLISGGPVGGALQESYNQITAYATLAKAKNLQLVAYEGGQHLVGNGVVQKNQAINNLFQRANRDPRMGEIYKQYITKWSQLGGGLFINYSDIGNYSKSGSWGALESVNQTGSPKYNALLDLIQGAG